MKYFNPLYIILLLLGMAFFILFKNGNQEVLSFYGFAESNETEINYNYSVVVDEILVTPGQEVKAGAELLKLSRVKSKETLADQDFKISQLRSESSLWLKKKENALKEIQLEEQTKLQSLNTQIAALKSKNEYKLSLLEGLKTIDKVSSVYDPILEKIAEIEKQKSAVIAKYELLQKSIKDEMAMGRDPYASQVSLLQAEKAFDEEHQVQEIIVKAPSDGLIGNVYCKEAEHIPAYRTLISFYEPHSSVIKGYVHENLTLEVELGSRFKVSSLIDATASYQGEVIGLGSRIVEIPTRLRKMPDLKTYGREVLVSINKNNVFLQKEKVALSLADEK